MTQKFKDDARALLASGITDTATTLLVESSYGDKFPVADMGGGTTGDWFKITLEGVTGEKEIIKVRTRAAGSDILSNLQRGQDGTVARTWSAGSGASATVVALRLTAADVENSFVQAGREWYTVPVLAETTGRYLSRSDIGRCVPATGTINVPASVFVKDDIVVVYNDSSSDITISKDGGVNMWWVDSANADRVLKPRGLCSIFCIRDNEFVITGQGIE